jgi:hypothetical protein
MKKIQTLISAGAVAAVTAFPVFAQQATAQYTTNRMGNETAMSIAQRVGACSDAGIAAADFDSDSLIRVTCADRDAGGLEGGLGTGAAIGGALAAVALISLASDGSGSTTTTTTTTTTGTTN